MSNAFKQVLNTPKPRIVQPAALSWSNTLLQNSSVDYAVNNLTFAPSKK